MYTLGQSFILHAMDTGSLRYHGMLDLQGYVDYFAGLLQDYEYPAEEVKAAMAAFTDFARIT